MRGGFRCAVYVRLASDAQFQGPLSDSATVRMQFPTSVCNRIGQLQKVLKRRTATDGLLSAVHRRTFREGSLFVEARRGIHRATAQIDSHSVLYSFDAYVFTALL